MNVGPTRSRDLTMQNLRTFFLSTMVMATASWPATTFAADESQADRENIRSAQRQIHSPIIAQRIEGIKRLQNTPTQDVVKLIMSLGFGNTAVEVQRPPTKPF